MNSIKAFSPFNLSSLAGGYTLLAPAPKKVYSRLYNYHNSTTFGVLGYLKERIKQLVGYFFSSSTIYNNATASLLKNCLKDKICKILKPQDSEANANLQDKVLLTAQSVQLAAIRTLASSCVGDKKALKQIFENNPLLSLALIQGLEKKNLAYCRSIDDLVNTLFYSMDWKLKQGPLFQLIQEIETFFNEAAASNSTEKLIEFLAHFDIENRAINTDLLQASDLLTTDHPISDVHYVSIEYKGIYECGGLAEAVFGIAKSYKDQNPHTPCHVVLPYMPHVMSSSVRARCSEPTPLDGTLSYRTLQLGDLNIVLIEDPLFDKTKKLYDTDCINWMLRFSHLASSYLLQKTSSNSIIHLHDWHVARMAALIKEGSVHLKEKEKPTVVFTFHNNSLTCQGRYGSEGSPYAARTLLAPHQDRQFGLNLQAQAIACSDIISTVSPTYAKECLSSKGNGLESLLAQAQKTDRFWGILNGIDLATWSAYTDPILKNWISIQTNQPLDLCFKEDQNPFDTKKLALNELDAWIRKFWPNKTKHLDLTKPLFIYTGRFDYHQKGLDKLPALIEEISQLKGNVVLLGSSMDDDSKALLSKLDKNYADTPNIIIIRDDRINGKFVYQEGTASQPPIKSLVRMAANVVMMPSNFEPCGLVQMESWNYGSLVIAKKTGGLADTVVPLLEDRVNGNGFFLEDSSAKELIKTAFTASLNKDVTFQIVKNVEKYDWSYKPETGLSKSEAYLKLYKQAHTLKNKTSLETTGFNFKARWIHPSKFYEVDPQNTKLHQLLGSFNVPGGVKFNLFAPKAKSVVLQVFDDRGERTSSFDLFLSTVNSTWELNLPVQTNLNYRYLIDGKVKIDPFATSFTYLPNDKKIPVCVHLIEADKEHIWTDQTFVQTRAERRSLETTSSIFELNLSHFGKEGEKVLTYDELADKAIAHCQHHGFKEIELMGISEHPYEPSLGYQVTGFFAPNHRFGSPKDFKRFVDKLHNAGISITVDFVFNHFAKDDWALAKFDGSSLFEKSTFYDLRQYYGWGKYFDFNNPLSQRFLFSAVRNWIETYHIDGLRIDAIRPALKEVGSPANLFLQNLNAFIHKHFPGVITQAEDYRSSDLAIQEFSKQGLQFDAKWNLGMVHNALSYLANPNHPVQKLQKMITDSHFRGVFSLSHDHLNDTLGFLGTRVKTDEALKGAKLAQVVFLAQLLPGSKLYYHDKEALAVLSQIQAYKEGRSEVVKELLADIQSEVLDVETLKNPSLLSLSLKKGTRTWQILLNCSPKEQDFPEEFKGFTKYANSLLSKDDKTLKLQPFELAALRLSDEEDEV